MKTWGSVSIKGSTRGLVYLAENDRRLAWSFNWSDSVSSGYKASAYLDRDTAVATEWLDTQSYDPLD
jgi:hypothetical protein